jgi:hypothetical protein
MSQLAFYDGICNLKMKKRGKNKNLCNNIDSPQETQMGSKEKHQLRTRRKIHTRGT